MEGIGGSFGQWLHILVVDLVDRMEPSNIIKMAKKENIPVIFFNREPVREDLMQWDRLYYVGGDAKQSGTMQGEIAAEVIRADPAVDRNADGKVSTLKKRCCKW